MTKPPLSLLAQKALLAGVALYRLAARPLLPRSCRFAPSCSEFARQALIVHGPWRGLAFSLARLLRCNPLHPGGYDPIINENFPPRRGEKFRGPPPRSYYHG